LGTDA
jgi:hypothetical protein